MQYVIVMQSTLNLKHVNDILHCILIHLFVHCVCVLVGVIKAIIFDRVNLKCICLNKQQYSVFTYLHRSTVTWGIKVCRDCKGLCRQLHVLGYQVFRYAVPVLWEFEQDTWNDTTGSLSLVSQYLGVTAHPNDDAFYSRVSLYWGMYICFLHFVQKGESPLLAHLFPQQLFQEVSHPSTNKAQSAQFHQFGM